MPDPGQLVGPDTLTRPSDQPPPSDLGFFAPAYTPPDVTGLFDYPNTASADQSGAAPYTQYLVDVEYAFSSGRVQQPVAGPDGTACEFPQVAAPWWSKEARWTVERLGQWPTCPAWATGDANLVLLGGRIKPCSPLDGPNGVKVFRVEGVYRYGLLRPPAGNQPDLPVSDLPVNTDPFDTFPGASLTTAILDGAGLRTL